MGPPLCGRMEKKLQNYCSVQGLGSRVSTEMNAPDRLILRVPLYICVYIHIITMVSIPCTVRKCDLGLRGCVIHPIQVRWGCL